MADFYFDKYEITVGRFRQFVKAGMGTRANPPAAGAGAHPLIAGSGWDSTWNTYLHANAVDMEAAVKCDASNQTWTDEAGSNESQPMNCLDWYLAFAFCAWDGGRLATDDSYAVYCGGSCRAQKVGSKSPKGDGKWGHSDLAGNVEEWTLDWYSSSYPTPCNNCSELTRASDRVVRGGSFYYGAEFLLSDYRYNFSDPKIPSRTIGARCARSNP